MRPDGTRVKDLPPLVAAIPYIMPKRYDAWNSVTENIDEEVIKDFIRTHRRAGVRLNHMSVIISAYYKAVLRNPKLNYFVMNGRIYRRNHFCVSFVILKKQADGVVNETTLKVYLDENDTVFTVNQKIKDAIDANKAEHQTNSTDKFAKFMFSVPGLPKFVVWLAYHLDKHGLLPRKIIDLSPFHTSMFITNLASIKTSYIHHHCYEFGTTSVFVCMGKPVPNYISGDLTKKMMPIGVVMDERICTAATDVDYTPVHHEYHFDKEVYDNRLYYGFGKADPSVELVIGPNITDWPKMYNLTENLLVELAAVIHDPVTTTDELIPSGETSSYRSNPLRLAEFTLSRRVPEYVPRAKDVAAREAQRRQGDVPASLLEVLGRVGDAQALAKNTQFGSCVFANKPGDGSAREQAASCQKVLGGFANICYEYATKRYRSNCINWGILPFTIDQGTPFDY